MELEGPLLDSIREEFPTFCIVRKQGNFFSRAIDLALKIVTLGSQREYLTRYHTVIGTTLYVPLSWDHTGEVDRVILLRHERVHLRQRRRLGMPLMAFL